MANNNTTPETSVIVAVIVLFFINLLIAVAGIFWGLFPLMDHFDIPGGAVLWTVLFLLAISGNLFGTKFKTTRN